MELYSAAIQLKAVAMYILHWTPQHTMVTSGIHGSQSSVFIYSFDVYLLYIPPDSVRSSPRLQAFFEEDSYVCAWVGLINT